MTQAVLRIEDTVSATLESTIGNSSLLKNRMMSNHYLLLLFESLTKYLFVNQNFVKYLLFSSKYISTFALSSPQFPKMKLFALFLFFSLVAAGQKNNQKRQKRKLSRKEFRKCKSENCSDSCQQGQLKTPACISCIQSVMVSWIRIKLSRHLTLLLLIQ